jgi:S-adenosylmethionine hydrolase
VIVLFTDFGVGSPYVAQMKAVLFSAAPGVPIIDLFSDAPRYDPQLSAYLLAAYTHEFPTGTVFLCVVDPGVGGERRAALVRADERWYVGPDNGILDVVARRSVHVQWHDLLWRPNRLSASFHGRDLFAPVAAALACGEVPEARPQPLGDRADLSCPDDLPRILYIDHFGNAMTGVRASICGPGTVLRVQGQNLPRARTFCEVPPGQGFWYENANGLVEIVVSGGRADRRYALRVGDRVEISAARS